MTCIAAVTAGRRTYLGGDSLVAFGEYLIATTGPKVWVSPSGWAVGCAGESTWCDVVARTDLPKDPAEVTQAVAVALRVRYGARLDNAEGRPDGCGLMGRGGRLWYLEPDGAMVELLDGYAATGSGGDVAVGTLCGSVGLKPRARIVRALAAAARHTPFVRPPFTIVSA